MLACDALSFLPSLICYSHNPMKANFIKIYEIQSTRGAELANTDQAHAAYSNTPETLVQRHVVDGGNPFTPRSS